MNMDSRTGTDRSPRPQAEHRSSSTVPQRRRPAPSNQQNRSQFYHDSTRPNQPRRRRRRRRARDARKLMIVGLASVILLIVSLVLLIRSCVNYNPLVGKWAVDSMTSYIFYEDGTGIMVVPRNRYSFTYTMEDDWLFIDFEDEKALDSAFEYDKDGDKLTLVGGNEDNRGTFVLTLQE